MHSLAELYNDFGGFLSKLDLSTMHIETKNQLNDFKNQYQKLNKLINRIDSNSYFFRFPIDKKGKKHDLVLEKDDFFKIIKLLYFTDGFKTFTLPVLEDEGIIEGLVDTE